MEAGTLAGRYSKLETTRQPYLERARDCAKLTIPALMPPDGSSGSTQFITPYQSMGARGVNNLASKLLLSLIPTNSPFFRLQLDDFTAEELTKRKDMKAELEQGLSKVERAMMSEIETMALRVSGFEGFKQLLVAGNALIYTPDSGGVRVFRMDHYVVKRDPSGNLLEAILKEEIAPATLPADVQKMLGDDIKDKDGSFKSTALYTSCCLRDGKWYLYQEIAGKAIPGTEATYPLDSCPMIALRFIRVDGEDYGRSYVEEYFGDLKSLEGLEKAILFGAAAAAKVLFLVNPNGTTKPKDVAEAPSGSVRSGNANDVSVLQMQKFADFRVALEKTVDLKERLAQAFLLHSSVQRNGERVTAEEIRYMAQELETALGGIYSIMAQEFQLPLVNRVMAVMQRKGKLPRLPKGTVKPVIVTGLEALGRGHDLNKLDLFLQGIPPEAKQEAYARVDWGKYLTLRAAHLGISQDGLIKSAEQVAQEQTQAQQQAMAQSVVDKGAGPAIKAAADAMAQQPPQQ
jgi:hypothetical protein